jgi:DNA repair exonuclease SbcCD ATPase subunit
MDLSETSVIKIEDGQLRLRVTSIAEAKLAIKELKIKKKELGLLKREINAQQRELRATHTHNVRTQGPMMRGGGGFGKFIRAVQTASRHSDRSNLARSLAPLESEKLRIEKDISGFDSLILQLESYIIQNG